MYDVELTSKGLEWKTLDSGPETCHSYMPHFGINKCLATGFTRLFCAIDENISNDDRLELSLYVKTTNQVEHLTIAVTGGRRINMAIRNEQTRPAEQIKILLLQGHLAVTDINDNLPIRVEYGSDCNEFSLSVPEGFSATRYRRFDGDNLVIYEGSSVVKLPLCFRVIPSGNPPAALGLQPTSTVLSPIVELESNQNQPIVHPSFNDTEIDIILNITENVVDDSSTASRSIWDLFKSRNSMTFETSRILYRLFFLGLIYAIIFLLIIVALIPLCLGVFYHVYCNENRTAEYNLEHPECDRVSVSNPSYVSHATQTIDAPIRI